MKEQNRKDDHSGYSHIAQEICEQPPRPNRITPSKLSRLAKMVAAGEIKNLEESKLTELQNKLEILEASKCDRKTVGSILDQKLTILAKDENNIVVRETDSSDTKQPLDFAKMDYDTVHREIIDIKSCRTNIFVGTLGIIGAISVAILGILGAKEGGAPLLAWLPWAAAIPVALLTSAILATIHKARAINERIGYMEALSKDLMKENGPKYKYFQGWSQANCVGRYCRIYCENWQLPHVCPFDKNKTNCIDEAETKAYREINRYIKWRPDLLNSFTSLSAHIYSIAYVVAFIGLLWAVMASLHKYISKTQSDKYFNPIFWTVVTIGGLITAILARKIVKIKHQNPDESPKKVKHETWFKWYGYISGAIVPLLIIGLVIAYRIGVSASWMSMLGYSVGGLIAITAVFLAYSLYEKVNSLRRGIYSVNCWRHIWELRFNQCKFMVASFPQSPI
jgi:hypothetical protein